MLTIVSIISIVEYILINNKNQLSLYQLEQLKKLGEISS